MMADSQFFNQNELTVRRTNFASTPKPKWVTPEIDEKNEKQKKLKLGDNISTVERLVLCLAELAGTALLVFLGCAGCARSVAGEKIPAEQISLTFGLAVMVSVQIFGHISGGHINPIATVAAATLGHMSLVQVPLFIVSQMLGALAGFGLVKAVIPSELFKSSPNETVSLCSPNPNSNLTSLQVFLMEFMLSLIFVWVLCGIWDSRNNKKHDSVPIRVGLAVAGLAMAGGAYTGAHLNPARSFGPALINGDWSNHWIYWVGPLSASFMGALVYRMIFSKDPAPDDEAVLEVQASPNKT